MQPRLRTLKEIKEKKCYYFDEFPQNLRNDSVYTVFNVMFPISASDYTYEYAIVNDLVYSMLTHGHMAPGPLVESY